MKKYMFEVAKMIGGPISGSIVVEEKSIKTLFTERNYDAAYFDAKVLYCGNIVVGHFLVDNVVEPVSSRPSNLRNTINDLNGFCHEWEAILYCGVFSDGHFCDIWYEISTGKCTAFVDNTLQTDAGLWAEVWRKNNSSSRAGLRIPTLQEYMDAGDAWLSKLNKPTDNN